ncbi:MAG TPA: OmpA family protein [Blastocatellia bacterium]|nr:OmpA family protein [Blastocatellia bacterium]
MRAGIRLIHLALMLLILSGVASAQNSDTNNLAERQKAPTVLGGSGLFNTFSTRTLARGEWNFALFWNNFDRDPGDIDINQAPFNFTVGLTNRWELWVDWVAWQQTTSRTPFLLSGYQYNAVRRFGDPFDILGPPVGGDGSAAFFPGTGATGGGILPVLGRFGTPAGSNGSNIISPGGPGAPVALGLGPAIITDRPAFYNDLPFFGEIDFIGFDGLGRPLLSLRQSSNGASDVYVGAKYKIIDPNTNWFSIALGGYLKIPVSREDHARARGRTSGEYEYGPVLMLGQEFADHRFRVYENIGYIHTGDIEQRGVKVLDLRDKLLLNVGASFAVNKHVELLGELLHTRYVGNGTPSLFRNNPVELNLGARFYLKDGAVSFGGAYRRFLNSDGATSLTVLECYMFHPGTEDYGPPRLKCEPERAEFGNGDSNGFVGFFSVGKRKGCPLPPVPTCTLEAAPTTVTRGDRISLTIRPTTVGYTDADIVYEYRWEARDQQGRPVTISGSGQSIDVPTGRLDCGRYTVTAIVTAVLAASGFPDECVTSGQTTCAASFEITEPPCPSVTCQIMGAPASTIRSGDVVRLRASGSGDSNLSYRWMTTGGRLSSATGTEVIVDTTGLGPGSYTVTVDVATGRTSCGEECRGASCSVTFRIGEQPVTCVDILVPCGPIFFPFNSARINNEHKACLEEISLRLQQDPRAYVVIDGHRDSSERVGISLTRANNARDYLVSIGVSAGRITVRNFGDTCPHPNGDPALNRRVEFYIVPGDYRSEPPPCVPPEEAIRRMKNCPGGRVITDESPATERRPPSRTQRRGTRRPEPVSELEDDDSDDGDEERGDGAPNVSTPRRETPVSAAGLARQPAPAAAPATVIRSIRTSLMGGVLRIYIDSDGAAQFNAFALSGPSRIVVDVRGVRNLFGNKVIPIDARFAERVRVGQPDPTTVRIVLDLTGQVPYEVIREGSSIVIVVGERGTTARTGGQ